MIEGTFGSTIVTELPGNELWENPQSTHKATHSDTLMFAAQGQIILVKEAERPSQRMHFKTSLIKKWGGDAHFVGSKKFKSAESASVQGNIVLWTNRLEIHVPAVSNQK